MLSNTLNTNEIKNASAAEVEFNRISTAARSTEFAQIAETPNQPHRLKVSHQESGTGSTARRRSLVRFDKTVIGVSGVPRTISAYTVLDAPVGDLSASTELKNTLAELLSFCSTTGAGTTVLFDCSGNGATVLIDGAL